MSTREVITLQLGHYANFVGAHWWNLQEGNFSYDPTKPSEINHDVLYREGQNPKREVTFTPRLLSVDLKGSLGYLSEHGNLYDDDDTQTDADSLCLWNPDNIEITKEEKVPKAPFIQSLEDNNSIELIDDKIDSWVDYLVPRFHPRTINIIKEYKHKDDDKKFDIFNYGKNLWQTNQFQDDFSDKIRAYAEECDLMQGFQVLMDCTDSFGGLGSSCIEYLHDEYGKSILTFPLIDSTINEPSINDLIKSLNIALCWQHIGDNTSIYSPLCCNEEGWSPKKPRKFNNIIYNENSKYHTSAILATALDTLSIRYRHKNYPGSALSDLCADMNKQGRKAAAMSLSLPFPMTVKNDLIDILDDIETSLWTSLTPNCEISGERNMQSFSLRGIPENRLKRPMIDAKKQMGKPAYRCTTVHEMMTMYLAYSCHASATYLTNVTEPLKINTPYPNIFNNNLHENGDIADWPVGETVKTIPVMAGLHSTSEMSKMFESLHEHVSKIKNIKKYHAFGESGLEQDDLTECLNHLLDTKESYEENYV